MNKRLAFALRRGQHIDATVQCYQSLDMSLSSVSLLKIFALHFLICFWSFVAVLSPLGQHFLGCRAHFVRYIKYNIILYGGNTFVHPRMAVGVSVTVHFTFVWVSFLCQYLNFACHKLDLDDHDVTSLIFDGCLLFW